MKRLFMGVFITAFMLSCNNEKTEEKTTGTETAKSSNADELLDMSLGDGVKASFAAFEKGDIDGMTANYDDNIMYRWSGGDSLVGKQAVKDYYIGRWKLIDSLSVTDHVVLPVKVNNVQTQYQAPGKWVLHWGFIHVKYKNGKKLNFWVHNDYHYNEAGKVDVAIQYIDRQLLIEATKDLMPK